VVSMELVAWDLPRLPQAEQQPATGLVEEAQLHRSAVAVKLAATDRSAFGLSTSIRSLGAMDVVELEA
jgi:hypothetical protein